MKEKALRWLAFFAVLFGTFLLAQDVKEKDVEALFKQLEPKAVRLEKTTTPNGPFWIGYDKKGCRVAVFVLTSAIARKESLGYSGRPVPAVLCLEPTSLRIRAIKFLPNDETPVYAGEMFKPEFARQYVGKGPSDAFEAGKDVAAISGATYTTRAINRSIRTSLHRVKAAIFGQKLPKTAKAHIPWLQTILIAALFCAAICAFLARLARIRLLILAVSVLFLGFIWSGLMLSARNIVDLITHPSDFVAGPFFSSPPLVILLIGGLVLCVVFGRIYCGYICPFGALGEIIWTFNPKKIRVKPSVARKARFVKYGLLGVLIGFGFWLPRVDILKHIEPFGPTFRMMDIGATVVALVIIGLCAFIFRFYCRFLCPIGAVFEVLAFLRVFRRRILPRKCRACGDCVLVCPSAAIHWRGKKVVFDPSLCFLCADCSVERRGKECTK